MTGVSRGLNIRSSMKRSIQSVALDSLSCSSSEGHPTVNFFFPVLLLYYGVDNA